MVYPEVIHGKFVDLRSITLDDAEFSYNIRADKNNAATVGQLAASVEAQRMFIEWQMQEPNDYYFVVLNKQGERIGLIGVYSIHDDVGEMGREVNNGEPTEMLEPDILMRDFCKNTLKLKKLCGVVYSNNVHHISVVKKRGSKLVGKIMRSGHEALCFEDDLYEESPMVRKIRTMLAKLCAKQNVGGV